MSCLELNDQQALSVAEPMMDDIMLGLIRMDFVLHCRHHSVSLRSTLTPEEFLELGTTREKAWGRPGARTLITILRKPKTFTLLWVQEFDKSEGEVLALLTVAHKGGRHFVDNFELH